MDKNNDSTMPVLEHLAELRFRLMISAGVLLIAMFTSFAFVDNIRGILTDLLDGLMLIYLSPPEAFLANLRLAFISGIVLSSPVIVYELIAFIFPGLHRKEKKFFLLILAGIFILFTGGVCFAYFVAFPYTLNFFLSFSADGLDPLFTVSEYISFVLSIHVAFGLIFQLPLLSWALGKAGLVSTDFLRRSRKYALLILLAVSALITPPDIVSQVIMVIPLLALYEVGILMVRLSGKSANSK